MPVPSRRNVSGTPCDRARRHDLRHRHAGSRRIGRAAAEVLAHELARAERGHAAEVRHSRFVLPVVVDQRFHRVGVFLRVAPASILPHGHHPADDLPHRHVGHARLDERVQHDGRRSDVRVPEPEQVGIGQLFDVRAAALGQDRIRHPSSQVRDSIAARLALREHRVMEVGEREDRHAIAIAVEARQVRVLIAPALDEHLHGKRLPCGV